MAEQTTPITDIQKNLRLASTVYPTVPQIVVDGVFGPQTALAVREFQRANGMEPTGRVDYETWELLRLTGNIINELNSSPVNGVNFPADYTVGSHNSDSEYAYYIAVMLDRIGRMWGKSWRIDFSDPYGENTVSAVADFQHIAGLDPTGVTDKKTWIAISNIYIAYE